MNHLFDLLTVIDKKVMSFAREHGAIPSLISVSRSAYRRLIELRSDEGKIGNLVIGCRPISELETPGGAIALQVDEMLNETDVVVA